MISILQRKTARGVVWPSTIRRRAERLLRAFQQEGADLVVVLTDDAEIRGLNATWRQKDAATDVLSFPQQEGAEMPCAPGFVPPLGDVVISLETAARQAGRGCLPRLGIKLGEDRWTVLDETTFLLLHGVLHLCGYDHVDDTDAEEMEALEAELLPGLIRR